MRVLKAAVVGMGVLIVAGVAVLAVLLAQRVAGGPAGAVVPRVLDEPAGTHMAAATAAGDRLTVLLSGGGPDRAVVLDLRTGQVVARAVLAR
jgi:hypothetical protein